MRRFDPGSRLAACALAGLVWTAASPKLAAEQGALAPQVTMVFSGDEQVRRVYLDVPHSGHLKPSWYGESVGHYEGGDTLVVDTIGQNDKTFLDGFHTPHTEKLHVVSAIH
jgi:hypothetical protein